MGSWYAPPSLSARRSAVEFPGSLSVSVDG